MRKHLLIFSCLLWALSSYSITKQEFTSLMTDGKLVVSTTSLVDTDQKMTFYPNGTGVWELLPGGTLGALSALMTSFDWSSSGSVNMYLTCDGAKAACYIGSEVNFKWIVDKSGNIRVSYTSVKKNVAKIVNWETYYVNEQVRCINSMLNKYKKIAPAFIGETDVYSPSFNESRIELYEHGSSNTVFSGSVTIVKYEPQKTPVEYPGGTSAIQYYVQEHQVYPASLRQDGYRESLDFVLEVDAQGNVTTVRCNTNNELTQYTAGLLTNLPEKFTPATIDGVKVNSTYDVTIHYYTSQAISLATTDVKFDYTSGKTEILVNSLDPDWKVSVPNGSFFTARRDYEYIIVSCPERKYNELKARTGKFYVQTADGANKYAVKVTQKGAPAPYIRPDQIYVYLPRKKKEARAIVNVNSNRDWQVKNDESESNIVAEKTDNSIVFTVKKDGKKEGEDAKFTIESVDKDCKTSIKVHQCSRQEEKLQGSRSNSSGLGLWYNYYDKYGSFELGIFSAQIGAGCSLPLFHETSQGRIFASEAYFPLNFELGTLRFHFVEMSLLNFRLDLSMGGYDGFVWEPQVRGLLPVSDRWALLPYVGPVCQFDFNDITNSMWSVSGGLIARVRYGNATHTDLSIGYRGGQNGGIAVGVSIGWSLGW